MPEDGNEPTQKTQPFTDEEPVEIPVPSKDQIEADFTKIVSADSDNERDKS